MTYTFTTDYGNGIILAPCLQVLCAEIAKVYPDAVNVGEIGNAAHQAEGYQSDHNPFIVHNDQRYVRAIDIGGAEEIQNALFSFFMNLYVKRDPRIYPYGYVHKDDVITKWFGNGDTKYQPNLDLQSDPGDVGHLHISVTQQNGYDPGPNGWVPALDSRAPWGLLPANQSSEDDEMKGFVAHDGSNNWWVIAADLSSRVQVTPGAADALTKTGQYLNNPGIDQTSLVHIPDVTARS